MISEATIKDVARLSGVSTMTVTRAFRNDAPVSPATKEKVMAAAAQLNYRPNMNARVLRGGSTRSVGIIMSNPAESKIVRQVSEKLMADKYVTYIADNLGDSELTESVIREFTARKVDAIVMDWRSGYRYLSELLGTLKNIIFFTNEQEIVHDFDCCFIDSLPAIREATQLFFSHGKREIFYLGRSKQNMARNVGLVMAEFGLDTQEYLIETSGYPSKQIYGNYYDALKEQLVRGVKPQVIFTYNDICAAQACRCLKDFGRRVPEDTAVVGNENHDFVEFCNPPIASFDRHLSLVGKNIRELLLNRLNNPDSPTQQRRIVAEFKLRKSAG